MEKLQPSYFFELSSFKHKAIFDDCSFVWSALNNIGPYLEQQSLGKIEVDIPEGVHLSNPDRISIGKGTVLEPGAYIKGPCIIGENCSVRQGAYLRGKVVAGDDCVLGHDSEFKNALLLDGAHAAHFAYVGDTILGSRANLGAGAVCANLKLDNKPVIVFFEGQRIETGLRKFGVIMGDGSQTGCNSVTNPGSLLGKNVKSYPCVNFGGFVPSGQIVRPETKPLFLEP
ncbi:MAG: UDP-N-acetylglucosamine diphosphorylase [Waddliaceae bacterium]